MRVAGGYGRVMLASEVGSRALWYLTRGSGAVSLLLLTSVVVLGVGNVVRWSPQATPRFVLQWIHRNLSLLALAFVAIHVMTVVIDGFAPIRWIDSVLPFDSAYRPVWLGFGALAFDLVLAVTLTSLLRARLGYRAWRVVHWTTYGTWVAAVLHGAGAGSDAREPWMVALVVASVVAVVGAVAWRVSRGWERWEPARALLIVGAVLLPPSLAVWMVTGPLRAGWATRAGTPPSLVSAAGGQGTSPSTIVLPERAAFSGSADLRRSTAGKAATLATSVRTTGEEPLSLSISLAGEQETEGFEVTSGNIRLFPPQGAATYRGQLSGLEDQTLTARLSDGYGDVIDIAVQMAISSTGQVQGQLAIGAVSSVEVGA